MTTTLADPWEELRSALTRPRLRHMAIAVAFAMSAYHLWTGFFGAGIAEVHYPMHLLLALLVLFLNDASREDPARTPLRLGYDLFAIALLVASCGYLFVNADELSMRMLFVSPVTPLQLFLGLALIGVVLEAARRTVGWAIVVVCAVFLIYARFGDLLPGALWHRGYGVSTIVEYTYLTTEGVFGVPVAVMANYVFHFVLFGAFLVASGAGSFFTDLAHALTGRLTGGPAKTAVVASTFMGMLSGSSAANVVTTGSFTIPAMRRSGYPGTFAAGVEAVASCGGQLTPPIMGAAAFIMMEFLGVPYGTIISIAIIPAALYFLGVYFMVDLEARRLGLVPRPDEAIPSLWSVLRRRGYLLLSVVTMLYYLFEGYTPTTAAVWATLSLVLLLLVLDGENRRRILTVAYTAMTSAPTLIGPVTVACAVGGILVGLIGLTGLGLRLSSIILDVAGGHLMVTLVLTLVMGIVLGMGMPTSGAYIILAALLAPGLIEIGVDPLAAHMFVMYAAAKSSITPPVAIASYAAAAVAGTDPWKTSLVAFRLGLSVFIIPFMFVYGPELLGLGAPLDVGLAVVTASVGVLALSVACIGWFAVDLGPLERVAALAASLLLIETSLAFDLAGIALFLLVAGLGWRRARVRRASGALS
ncbi:TRAP transporter permease [Acuticoccus sp.]|uniref:TRAP transporter permease n=1 Tax=Acuticoccus sp. TaxID=1904378 RepID=UPI003B51B019